MDTFTIVITQPTDKVTQVAQLLGWDGTGVARDFVLAALGPQVQDAVATIMLAPGKQAAQKALNDAFNANQQATASLEALRPQLIQTITIQ